MLRALRLLRDEGLVEFRRGRGDRDELIEIIRALGADPRAADSI